MEEPAALPVGNPAALLVGNPAENRAERPVEISDSNVRYQAEAKKKTSGVVLWLVQYEALFLKCMETLRRRWGALCLVVLAPTFAALCLDGLKGAAYQEDVFVPFPDTLELAPLDADGRYSLPECVVFDQFMRRTRMGCVNLAYTWTGGQDSRDMAEAIIEKIGAPAGVDRSAAFVMFDTQDAVAKAIFDNPGLYDAVLVVDGAGSTFDYALWKNDTSELIAYKKEGQYYHYIQVQHAIEQAATKCGIGSFTGSDGVSLTMKKLPALTVESGADGMVRNYPATLDTDASTLLILGLSMSVCLTIELVAYEKREGLLGLLRMTGLRESTYWLSWFVSLSVLNFASALLMALVGQATSLDLFTECDVFVHTLAAFLFMSATCALVLVFAAITKQAQYVQLAMFMLMLFSLVWQMTVVEIRSSDVPTDFWSKHSMSNPGIGAIYKVIFFFLPVYHYGKIIQNIYDVTGTEGGRSEYQAIDSRWRDTWPEYYNFGRIYDKIGWNSSLGLSACVDGTEPYRFGCKGLQPLCSNSTWSLPACPDGSMCDDNAECDWFDFEMRRVGSWWIPSAHDDMWCLIALTVFYLILSWYLAQIYSAGTGSSKRFYFVFQPSYWMGTSSQDQDIPDAAKREQEISGKEGSCRLSKLSKSYQTCTALKELTLQMQANEIFCLLGHNGAGKSTTINLLTGLHPPTHGHAFVCGHSIVTSTNLIQDIMGVCPQDNVLFDGLTAASHMSFWGRFKGMARQRARDESDRLLEKVALGEVKHKAAGAYSGGMKRRLSIAIASTACPHIVFLDEPTTGLDPLSRMRTWESIRDLKDGRVVCLTTHSMEEAEALGDIIGILANAKLRALGTPLYLKGKYGRGYQLTIMGDHKNTDKNLQLIRAMLPNAEVISNESGRIVLGIPKRIFHLFPAFFAKLEDDATAGKSLVDEWGLSASTLEEVFLKVAVANNSVNAEVEDKDASDLYPGLALNTRQGEYVMVTLNVDGGKQPVRVNHVMGVACEKSREEAAGPSDPSQPLLLGLDEDARGGEGAPKEAPAGGGEREQGARPEAGPPPPQMQEMLELVVPRGAAGKRWPVQCPDGSYVTAIIPANAREGESMQVPFTREHDLGVPDDGLLPNPDQVFEPPSCLPARQVGALLRKSYTLQKRQWKANLCRCCCVCSCVLINVLLLLLSSLMASAVFRFDDPCPKNYRIYSPDWAWYASDRQGQPYQSDPKCREEDFVAFLLGEEQCKLYSLTTVTNDPKYNSWTSIERNGACWRVDTWQRWGHEMLEGCYGAIGCPVTHTDDNFPASCPAGGSPNFTTACAPREQLPDLCGIRGSQARSAASFEPGEEDDEYWQQPESLNQWQGLRLPVQTQEAMSRARIWHDGQAMDASWFTGLVDERYITSDSFSAGYPGSSGNTSGVPTWLCGSSQLELREVSSIPDVFMARQEAKKASERTVDSFACEVPEDGVSYQWEFRNYLGIDTKFFDSKMPYDESDVEDVIDNFFAPDNAFPDIGLSFKSSDVGNGRASFDIWVYGQDFDSVDVNGDENLRIEAPYPYVMTAFKLTDQTPTDCAVLSAAAPTQPAAVRATVTALHNGLFFNMGATEPLIKSRVVPFPWIEFPTNISFRFLAMVILILPMLSMLYFPVMTSTMQQERSDRNVLAMQMQSLKLPTYWIATYLWNTFLYWSIMGVYYFFGVLTSSEIFTDVSHGRLLLTLALWCHAQICSATFLASVLGQSRLTALITYSIILATCIAAPVMFRYVLIAVDANAWPFYVFLIPPVNFVRSLLIILVRGKTAYSDDENNELLMAFLLQFFWGLFLFVAGIIIHMMLSTEGSAVAHLRSRMSKSRPPAAEEQLHLDPDVQAEVDRVASTPADVFTVRVQDLQKIYPSGFRAVKGVSFGIETGECFGLLGPNGAGKTTIISMLSGSTAISAGQATVCNMDVQTQQSSVYQNLGICPQFDIYWRDATVLDHLLLFARLKGIPAKQVMPLATRVAEAVGLSGDPFRMAAEQLSGGQRRRLSLAIALVANPKVVFLDEPSTGLDPVTRQALWKIVTNMRANRAIILTTHSMEEADALCHRIGIMAKGQLRCIGTSLHLKNKFGRGYQLAISLEGAPRINASTVMKNAFQNRLLLLDDLIKREVCEAARPTETWKGATLRTYELPMEDLKVSKVFEVLSQPKIYTEYKIQDWSLNQTSLNDVFTRIATASEDGRQVTP